MANVRAKFRCLSVESYSTDGSGQRTYRFSAVGDSEIPEDQSYSKYTPIGELRIMVDNPKVEFVPSTDYYLDFTPVSD